MAAAAHSIDMVKMSLAANATSSCHLQRCCTVCFTSDMVCECICCCGCCRRGGRLRRGAREACRWCGERRATTPAAASSAACAARRATASRRWPPCPSRRTCRSGCRGGPQAAAPPPRRRPRRRSRPSRCQVQLCPPGRRRRSRARTAGTGNGGPCSNQRSPCNGPIGLGLSLSNILRVGHWMSLHVPTTSSTDGTHMAPGTC